MTTWLTKPILTHTVKQLNISMLYLQIIVIFHYEPRVINAITTTTTTTILRSFFQDQPGEPVPEENFWTLRCKGRLVEADTLTIRLGATPSGLTSAHLHPPPFFYRPDALPATQPTVSKHWRQPAHSDWWEDARVLLNGVNCAVSVPH